ncbi:MAG: hypothetical protein [Caudoviricetes sp.]|nr:MAG: hypothetical protein [Caudoviricetes sp.]
MTRVRLSTSLFLPSVVAPDTMIDIRYYLLAVFSEQGVVQETPFTLYAANWCGKKKLNLDEANCSFKAYNKIWFQLASLNCLSFQAAKIKFLHGFEVANLHLNYRTVRGGQHNHLSPPSYAYLGKPLRISVDWKLCSLCGGYIL